MKEEQLMLGIGWERILYLVFADLNLVWKSVWNKIVQQKFLKSDHGMSQMWPDESTQQEIDLKGE